MSTRHQELHMKTHSIYRSRAMQWLSLSAIAWACAPTLAQGGRASAEADVAYQRERATCLNLPSAEERATCLREAAAAQAQRRKGATPEDAAAFERNALQRCDALPGDDRKDCIARMRGEGSTSGSVSGGGILREKVTVVPAPK
jgi:hypothetical protein